MIGYQCKLKEEENQVLQSEEEIYVQKKGKCMYGKICNKSVKMLTEDTNETE